MSIQDTIILKLQLLEKVTIKVKIKTKIQHQRQLIERTTLSYTCSSIHYRVLEFYKIIDQKKIALAIKFVNRNTY